MRIVLFTGKGGVGKSTVAAATATASARTGARTLVVSTDTAHSLSDAFGVSIGKDACEVAPLLEVAQVDTQARFERSWQQVAGYLRSVAEAAGVEAVAAEEMVVLPGVEEILALLAVCELAESGRYDAVILDCAPTAETLRLLALPETLGWYLDRVMPVQRRLTRLIGPVFKRSTGMPLPTDGVFDALAELHADLSRARELLSGPDASVRLVLTPERVVLAEARRCYTTLSLFGYRTDGVVVNRVFPHADGESTAASDEWRDTWVHAQRRVLDDVRSSFTPLTIRQAVYAEREPVGLEALTTFADRLYEGADPLSGAGEQPMAVTSSDEGATIRLSLPYVSTGQVSLTRNGDDLAVTIRSDASASDPGSRTYRRVVTLPGSLAGAEVRGATVKDGALRIVLAGTDAEGAGPGSADRREAVAR